MKLATLLGACLSFGFIAAGPTLPPKDVAPTAKSTWPVFKPSLDGWSTSDALSKRAHMVERSTAENAHSLHREGEASPAEKGPSVHTEGPPAYYSEHGHRGEPSTAGKSPSVHHEGEPSTSENSAAVEQSTAAHPRLPTWDGPTTFATAHSKWTPEQKIRWMSTAPFQWNIDDSTRRFAEKEKANVDGLFFWKKGVCEILQSLGCQHGLISMKKYPPMSRFMSFPVAEVHTTPFHGASKLMVTPWGDVSMIYPDGQVTPVIVGADGKVGPLLPQKEKPADEPTSKATAP